MELKKLSIVSFEISLVFLLLQQSVFPSQMTMESMIFNILCGVFLVYTHRGIFLNPYLKSSAVFLVLTVTGSLFGRGESGSLARDIRLVAFMLSSFFIYNYLFRIESVERFMKLYIAVHFVALVIILMLVGDRVLTSRLGHNGSGGIVSYWIAGTPIYKSSNATATVCATCVLFLLYYAEYRKKRWCYIPAAFFVVCVILCGSRKGILMLAIYVIYTLFFMKQGITLKKVALFILLPVTAYIIFMKIPLGYRLIGRRLESLVLNYLGYSNKMDGNSFLMRAYLKKEAWNWILEKPALGYGFGTFVNATGYGAENNMLQLLLEYGILGLVIYYAFLPALVIKIISRRNGNALVKLFSVLILTRLIQDCGSVTFPWQNITMWYSVFWAVMIRMGRMTDEDLQRSLSECRSNR